MKVMVMSYITKVMVIHQESNGHVIYHESDSYIMKVMVMSYMKRLAHMIMEMVDIYDRNDADNHISDGCLTDVLCMYDRGCHI